MKVRVALVLYYALLALLSAVMLMIDLSDNMLIVLFFMIFILSFVLLLTSLKRPFPFMDINQSRLNLAVGLSILGIMLVIKDHIVCYSLITVVALGAAAITTSFGMRSENSAT